MGSDDGESHHSGLRLCTNSFTLIDVVKLINILQVKYQLDCTLYIKVNKYPIIYIRANSIPRLQSIVLPYMHESIYQKIGLNKTIV